MFNLSNYKDHKNKIAIVTGANSGIGFYTTLNLAKKRFKVIMACRSMKKAEIAKNNIMQICPKADIEIFQLDLSSKKSIEDFAENIENQYGKINILINNAGVMNIDYTKTEDGFEGHFGINYLGHFYLTYLLLDKIVDSKESRVINLSSIAHKMGTINFEDINYDKNYNKMQAYAQSKLACLMFSNTLDKKLKSANKKIKSIAVHPGGSNTNLWRNIPFWFYPFYFIMYIFMSSPKKACHSTLYAALSESVLGGEYYGPKIFEIRGPIGKAKKSKLSKNKDLQKKLWSLSEKLLNINFDIK